METERPPLPPFTTVEAAVQKVRLERIWVALNREC